jgi:hypothetical protein
MDIPLRVHAVSFYGPNGAHARDLLARYTERVLEGTWPSGGQAPTVDDQVADNLLNQTEQAILSLQPDPQEPDFGGPPRASACGLGTFVGAVLRSTRRRLADLQGPAMWCYPLPVRRPRLARFRIRVKSGHKPCPAESWPCPERLTFLDRSSGLLSR